MVLLWILAVGSPTNSQPLEAPGFDAAPNEVVQPLSPEFAKECFDLVSDVSNRLGYRYSSPVETLSANFGSVLRADFIVQGRPVVPGTLNRLVCWKLSPSDKLNARTGFGLTLKPQSAYR